MSGGPIYSGDGFAWTDSGAAGDLAHLVITVGEQVAERTRCGLARTGTETRRSCRHARACPRCVDLCDPGYERSVEERVRAGGQAWPRISVTERIPPR